MTVATLGSLYTDAETGDRVTTHSMIKTFRRCPKQAQYKYVERLKPKEFQGHLNRGKWIHKLLELYHTGGDWREEHERWAHKFNRMFDEEKDKWGDLPNDILQVMLSYIWHYKHDEWEVLDVEFMVRTKFPDGTEYRGKVDALIKNQFGLWLIDHKSHKSLPDHKFRLLDAQSSLYLWAALREKYGVEGFIWNYVRWKPASTPTLIKDGTRFSKPTVASADYPTLLKAIKKHGFDPKDYADRLKYLYSLRYRPGEPQISENFRRDILEKQRPMLKQVAQEAYTTSQRMHSYDFSSPGVERVPDRSCTFSCSYPDLCTLELMGGGNPDFLRRKMYYVEDPMAYITDDEKDWRDNSRG